MICQSCWMETKHFHSFYLSIESKHIKQETIIIPDQNVNPAIIKQEENIKDFRIIEIDPIQDIEQSSIQNHTNEKLPKSKKQLTTTKKVLKQKNNNNDIIDEQIRTFFHMKCDNCDHIFNSYLEAKSHYRFKHQQIGYITCCGEKFFQRFKIVNHIVDAHLNSINRYNCEYCKQSFNRKRGIINHMQRHWPNDMRAFKCELCSKGFMTKFKLKTHIRNVHCDAREKKYICSQCGYK